jgi:DegV family protein with EDD domain
MTMANTNRFSGKAFFFGFLAGAKKIIENQHELNKINVFPVPDADTGTNLAVTMRHIMENVRPHESYRKTIDHIASAALEGAVGNSGIIFAQYLYGVSSESRDDSLPGLVLAFKNAVRHMMDAIANPVEGTMITVIREWAEFLENNRERFGNWRDLWNHSLDCARKSLSETTKKLDVLSRAHVVDAGARGMVLFLEGVMDFLKKPTFKKAYIELPSVFGLEDDVQADLPESVTYRFCTEAILKGQSLDRHQIQKTVEGLGDSLAIAGSEKTMRIHMHTSQPAQLFHRLKDFGTLSCQKADDMQIQLDTAHHRKWNIALLTDSSCDLPQDLMDFYQIHVIPLHLFFGENQYLDKLTVTPEQFYEMLEQSPVFPSTAQPAVKTFQTVYSRLASHYDSVIAIHLNHKFSGTYSNSLKAAERISLETGKPITVMDSKHLSGTLGLLVLRTARAVAQGLSHSEVVSHVHQWIFKTRIYVGVQTLKYMIRSGRVSPMKGHIANFLHLKPIVSIENGNSVLSDKSFTQRGSLKKILRRISGLHIWEYCVLHAHNKENASQYSEAIEKQTGKKPAFTMDISPVIGLHAGSGVVAVGLMSE